MYSLNMMVLREKKNRDLIERFFQRRNDDLLWMPFCSTENQIATETPSGKIVVDVANVANSPVADKLSTKVSTYIYIYIYLI